LVEGGGLDPVAVYVASDQSVALGSAERIGQDLVGDPVEGGMEVLVSTAPSVQLAEQG
jgi:hypothetical protein